MKVNRYSIRGRKKTGAPENPEIRFDSDHVHPHSIPLGKKTLVNYRGRGPSLAGQENRKTVRRVIHS